jgi:hypothetical protein
MTEETRTLGQHLIGLYKFTRIQQELLIRTSVQLQSVLKVLEASSVEVPEALKKAQKEVLANPSNRLLAETLQLTVATIQGLEKQYGPSSFPPGPTH